VAGGENRPFVAINCAEIPEKLLDSHLFGHVKGAFTGAAGDLLGVFRSAHGGTLFLGEIVEMPLHIQAKLLRAVQDREVIPIGTYTPILVNVRFIAATSHPFDRALAERRLRDDLFFRLSVNGYMHKKFGYCT
jgi:transcriptional regulator with PAS, ATPase and Fis domain